MATVEDGGNAFPIPGLQDHQEFNGMSLRDYFAAKAMQGICAHQDTWGLMDDEIVKKAYALADNMLTARGAQ